jgi:hypothetical protein
MDVDAGYPALQFVSSADPGCELAKCLSYRSLVSGLRSLYQRFELTVHFIPEFIFYLVAKQASLKGRAVGLIGNHMATLATQFAHLRFITLAFDHFVKWRTTLWQNFRLGQE